MASRLSISQISQESDRQIKVELQCFMWTHYCCQTNGQWSTLLSMMQHSSVSNLSIWVIFFPRTLEFMQIAVDCFLCCALFCVQCIPTTFLKTLAHSETHTHHSETPLYLDVQPLLAANPKTMQFKHWAKKCKKKKTYMKDAVAIQISQSVGLIMKAIPAHCYFNDSTYRLSVTHCHGRDNYNIFKADPDQIFLFWGPAVTPAGFIGWPQLQHITS